jgi:hypothetical protein
MTLKKGSMGWLAGSLIATHLRDQANNLASGLDEGVAWSDEDFTLVISFAINYWNVAPVHLADGFGVSISSVHRWATGQNLPQVFARKAVLEWIINDLRRRANEVQGIIDAAA